MKIKMIIFSVAAAALLAGCATKKAESQAQLMSQAKVSQAVARQTALARVPNGTVKDGELEKENGKLQWSFDVSTPGSNNIIEVNVNAITGEVISMQTESAADEATEKD
ncbi:MAG TPA: PepSY domain-containing protein [Verrucomicrobiae bacterium]|nr:PepSY domain-containing protein [Verrucomicrobiae bacterium]